MFGAGELIIWSRERMQFAESEEIVVEWEIQDWSYGNGNKI